VRAAYDGRLLHLFIADGAQEPGSYDQGTRSVRDGTSGSGDLLDLAALQTITHAGNVFVVPKERVPGGFNAAAALRF
jgi:hypothetical protein